MLPRIINVTITDDKFTPDLLKLGQMGENLATRVIIDASEWNAADWDYMLLVVRADGCCLPGHIAVEGSIITWDVLSDEIGAAGAGTVELSCRQGDVISKSAMCPTVVAKSHTGGNAPPSGTPWVEQVIDAAEDAAQAAEDAQASAQIAVAAKLDAQASADAAQKVGAAVELCEQAAKASAQAAGDSEQAAKESASEASTAAAQADAAIEVVSGVVKSVEEAAENALAAVAEMEQTTMTAVSLPAGSEPTVTAQEIDGHRNYQLGLVAGDKGERGDKGKQGDQGIQGAKGDTGAQGIQGERGERGAQGDQGIQGAKGDTGAQGIQGERGDKGDQGETGEDGTVVSLSQGYFYMEVVDGRLKLTHNDNEPSPPLSITENGRLIYTID